MFAKKNDKPVVVEASQQKVKKAKVETRWLRVKLPIGLHKEIRKRAIDADQTFGEFVADVLTKRFNLPKE